MIVSAVNRLSFLHLMYLRKQSALREIAAKPYLALMLIGL